VSVLSSAPTSSPYPDALINLLRGIAADPQLWMPAVRFDQDSRYWVRLPAPHDVDLWLLTWVPEQGTDLHDHGEAAAGLTVLSGVLTEVQVAPDGRRTATRLGSGATRWVAPGVIHDVTNTSDAPAVSLHAYSPRLRRMTYWEQGRRGLRPVRTVRTDRPELAAP
jgi:predicted metal-dependent enzyme (double-stranded beta helix superfamily)